MNRDGAVPQALVTGVGSLPHTDVDLAIEAVRRCCPLVPHWPQLPALDPDEGMLGRGGTFRAAAFEPFLDALHGGAFDDHVLVKGQQTGPLTLVGSGLDGDRAAPDAVRQVELLREAGARRVLIVLDEPVLGLGDHRLDLRSLQAAIDAIRDAGAAAGIHTCSRGTTGWTDELDVDVLSLDLTAHEGGDDLPDDVARWWSSSPTTAQAGDAASLGRRLAAGVLDPRTGSVSGPRTLIAGQPDAHASAAGRPQLILTPACGLVGVRQDEVAPTFAALDRLADRWNGTAPGSAGTSTAGDALGRDGAGRDGDRRGGVARPGSDPSGVSQ